MCGLEETVSGIVMIAHFVRKARASAEKAERNQPSVRPIRTSKIDIKFAIQDLKCFNLVCL
jgi:hypothetical protein